MPQRPVLKKNKPAQAPARNSDNTPSKFHNPYNFIPTLSRKVDHVELGDHHPRGHGAYHADLWSGRIAVTLTTETPLLIPDAAKVEIADNDHKTFPVRVDSQGKPYLAPTALKGMLRNAYESITNSRFGVFEEHSDRLAYRMEPRLGPVPARVELAAQGDLVLRLMTTNIPGDAGKLPRYKKGRNLPKDKGEGQAALKYQVTDDLPQHGEQVWVELGDAGYITAIRRFSDTPAQPDQWKKGWVCITGANIKEKKSERVFLASDEDQTIPVTEEISRLWGELVRNYQTVHKKDLEVRRKNGERPDHYLGQNPGKTAWSRHVYIISEARLKEGTLCYVDMKENAVLGVQPVTIARRLFKCAPSKLLHRSIKPATQMSELSPADRVFGWVKQQGKGAYKGNLRINSVTCETANAIEDFGNRGLPLGILGQPNPQQFRFYLEDKKGQPIPTDTDKTKGYSKGQSPRGRKVYPHHRQQTPETWENPVSRSDRPAYVGSDRTNQNRSIRGWVNPLTTFKFNIDVTNLSTVELGALLWLLNLPENHFHRLGGGKPFGFGSIRLALDVTNTDVQTGTQWQSFYSNLLPIEKQPCDIEQVINIYKDAITDAYAEQPKNAPAANRAGSGFAGLAALSQLAGPPFERVPFIKAFVVMSTGFDDELPIHYPRTTPAPNPNGEGFNWFVDNERVSGQKLALPLLTEDEGLPFSPKAND